MITDLKDIISEAIDDLYNSHAEIQKIQVEINRTSDSVHGDFYCNIAMKLAKILKQNPMSIADEIVNNIEKSDKILKIESAAPGYINFFITAHNKLQKIKFIIENDDIFETEEKLKKKVHVEYVSANPTGPLHIGHGRGMILGDVTARFLDYQGYKVNREYYVNDAGRQIDLLLVSTLLRYINKPDHIFVDERENTDGHLLIYKGKYIDKIASSLGGSLAQFDKTVVEDLIEDPIDTLITYLKNHSDYKLVRKALIDIVINDYIKIDLNAVDIEFDSWFYESELYDTGLLKEVLFNIEAKGLSYESEGALWFRNSKFGEEKDRVLRKNNGDMTYFATDIAYHIHKFNNHDILIDIWGADHHDYAIRLKTALSALGYDVENRLQIHLVQFANLIKAGQTISMSTRSGEFLPIKDLIDDIGKDATRFFYLTKKKDQHLEFDLDLASEKNKNNPIYYIQYAHARINKILEDLDEENILDENFESLKTKNEIEILEIIDKYHETIKRAIKEIRPDIITNYLYKISKVFHSYYAETKILTSKVQGERITLIRCIDKIILNCMKILDIKPMDIM